MISWMFLLVVDKLEPWSLARDRCDPDLRGRFQAIGELVEPA